MSKPGFDLDAEDEPVTDAFLDQVMSAAATTLPPPKSARVPLTMADLAGKGKGTHAASDELRASQAARVRDVRTKRRRRIEWGHEEDKELISLNIETPFGTLSMLRHVNGRVYFFYVG